MRRKGTWAIQTLRRVIILLLLTALSALAIFKIQSNAYLYVSFVWLIMISVFVKSAKTDKKRLFGIYAGSIFIAFFLAEFYFANSSKPKETESQFEFESIYGGLNTTREVIGLAPVKNSQWKTKLSYEGSLIYNVIQTIDSTGFRFTPGRATESQVPVLFFGCSFTFGAGLNDDQTLPYLFQKSNPDSFRAINMGYNSYGAHQTLAMLKSEMEKELLRDQKPKAAFYTAITDHAFRGTGGLNDYFGPKFRLNSEGNLVHHGTVALGDRELEIKIKYQLEKSHLLRRFLLARRKFKKREIDLFIAMIEEASTVFTNRYKVPFYCLLWEEPYAQPGLYKILLQELEEKDIAVIEVNDILPDYRENPSKYTIDKDGHPNELANQLIGEYLNKLISE